MTIRKKTVLIIIITFIVLIGLFYLISQIVVLNSFSQLEERRVNENLNRFTNAFFEELLQLQSTALDWSAWDDTYVFIEAVNEDYISSNLVDETFSDELLRINFILYISASGELVYSKGYDLENDVEIPFPQSWLKSLLTPQLINHTGEESSMNGIIIMPEGPMMVASTPIFKQPEKGARTRHLNYGPLV